MALSDPRPAATLAAPGAQADETSYVDWPAILAGAVLSWAIAFILLTFGSALGLSATSAREGSGVSAAGFAVAAALWLLWVQSSSCFAGGYLTGRLRRRKHDATEHESDVRDGSHGLVVWGLGVLVGAIVTISGATSAISTAANAVGAVAGAATNAAATVGAGAAAGNAGGGAYDLLIDRFLRAEPPAPGAAPASNGAAPASSPEAGQDAADLRAQIGRVVSDVVANGQINDADRRYLAQQVASRSGVDQPTAEARVNDLVQGVQNAETTARDAAEAARRAALLAAFATAASFLISGAAAYAGATLGGKHRDENTVVEGWSRLR